jgi:predicted pyridoxine 5'-phosphate oxidase superfamily flavin-nucleotide-binding protein
VPFTLHDPDVAAVIAAQRLCFAATVTPEGRPNLSPKGSIRVFDERHLFFLDLASPGTVRNLRSSPWIELNVVDPISRRGYRFRGRATLHAGDEVHAAALARIAADEGVAYAAERVVLVEVEEIGALWSPAYDHTPDERAIRELWRRRRAELDRAFEEHLSLHGTFQVPEDPGRT